MVGGDATVTADSHRASLGERASQQGLTRGTAPHPALRADLSAQAGRGEPNAHVDPTQNHHALAQAGAAEAFQVVLPVGFPFDRHLAGNPGQRNIGLRAAKFLQCSAGNFGFAGHAAGRRQHARLLAHSVRYCGVTTCRELGTNRKRPGGLVAVSPEWIRTRRSGDFGPGAALCRFRKFRHCPGGGRCPHRRLRARRSDPGGPTVRLSRHQDLHRRTEVGSSAARPGRRHRLPHHGDVRGLWFQRACAEGSLLDQRDDILET